jgi:hypothetical protein
MVVLGWQKPPAAVLRAQERRARLGRIDVKSIGPSLLDAKRVARYVVSGPGNGVNFARVNPGVQTFSKSRWPA